MDRPKRKRDDYYDDPRDYYGDRALRHPFYDVDVGELVQKNADLEDQMRDMLLDPQLMRQQIANLRQEKKRLQNDVSMLDVQAGPLHMLKETVKGLERSIAELQRENHLCYQELRSLKLSLGH